MPDPEHPDSELLDRLRAGLFDASPAEKSALEAHLSACPGCRARMDGWRQLSPAVLGPRNADTALSAELASARRQALRTASGTRRSWRFPAYATAALLLVALGTGLWWSLQTTLQGQGELAAVEDDSIPDPYEDLDFYLWLANQDESHDQQEHDNGNST